MAVPAKDVGIEPKLRLNDRDSATIIDERGLAALTAGIASLKESTVAGKSKRFVNFAYTKSKLAPYDNDHSLFQYAGRPPDPFRWH